MLILSEQYGEQSNKIKIDNLKTSILHKRFDSSRPPNGELNAILKKMLNRLPIFDLALCKYQ